MIGMVEFITSDNDQMGRKVVLWRRGNYQYQIEITKNGVTTTRDFYETEYYDAIDTFTQTIEGLDMVKQ